jgi:hypothetical protein
VLRDNAAAIRVSLPAGIAFCKIAYEHFRHETSLKRSGGCQQSHGYVKTGGTNTIHKACDVGPRSAKKTRRLIADVANKRKKGSNA